MEKLVYYIITGFLFQLIYFFLSLRIILYTKKFKYDTYVHDKNIKIGIEIIELRDSILYNVYVIIGAITILLIFFVFTLIYTRYVSYNKYLEDLRLVEVDKSEVIIEQEIKPVKIVSTVSYNIYTSLESISSINNIITISFVHENIIQNKIDKIHRSIYHDDICSLLKTDGQFYELFTLLENNYVEFENYIYEEQKKILDGTRIKTFMPFIDLHLSGYDENTKSWNQSYLPINIKPPNILSEVQTIFVKFTKNKIDIAAVILSLPYYTLEMIREFVETKLSSEKSKFKKLFKFRSNIFYFLYIPEKDLDITLSDMNDIIFKIASSDFKLNNPSVFIDTIDLFTKFDRQELINEMENTIKINNFSADIY